MNAFPNAFMPQWLPMHLKPNDGRMASRKVLAVFHPVIGRFILNTMNNKEYIDHSHDHVTLSKSEGEKEGGLQSRKERSQSTTRHGSLFLSH